MGNKSQLKERTGRRVGRGKRQKKRRRRERKGEREWWHFGRINEEGRGRGKRGNI